MKKKVLVISCNILLALAFVFMNISHVYAMDVNIDEVLNGKYYSSLSTNVKDYIKKYYEENGIILLTEELAEKGQPYLNPSFIEYLDSDNRKEYGFIPSDIIYSSNVTISSKKKLQKNSLKSTQTFPANFDLRDVNGKNFVTPNKQQDANNCWAYATASLLETHDLMVKNKSYDSNAILFSAKQLDYARSSNGIIGGNKTGLNFGLYTDLGDGAQLTAPLRLLVSYLGSATYDWDSANNTKISNNEPLDPSVVFNRNNFLYEADETREIYGMDENRKQAIKDNIYNHGGMVIGTCSNYISNGSSTNEYIGICNYLSSNHALHMIGWDDNYNYSYCKISNGNYKATNSNGTCYSGELITGVGAWILKNSWGSNKSFIYLPYDSMGSYQSLAITKYSDSKNWDNSYDLKTDDFNNTNEYTISSDMDFNEKAVKLKVRSSEDFSVYFSADGSDNYNLIGNYSTDYIGYKMIDLVDMNLNVNKNSKFKINSYASSVVLFTSNIESNGYGKTQDFVYSTSDTYATNEKYFNMPIKTEVRGINDNDKVTYKIKKTNFEYLPADSYSTTLNSEYYNLVTPIIKLKETYAKKGSYILETYHNNRLISTSTITLNTDFVSMKGSGTYEDPWQIENVLHFNTIRNSKYDNYVLMNDLDFEFDTQDSSGLYYNSGNGWNAIESFSGDFNGNGKIIKNLKTSSGLFNGFGATVNSKCKDYECGIHDLSVENSIYSKTSDDEWVDVLGGIINSVYSGQDYKYNFKNLSVKNFRINNITKTGSIGGIIGYFSVSNTVKIDNWYSDVNLNVNSFSNNSFGGAIGRLSVWDSNAYLSFNNVKTNVIFNPTTLTINADPVVSDIVGKIDHRNNGHIAFNNIISNFICPNNNSIEVFSPYAVVSDTSLLTSGNFTINGVKSTLNYKSNGLINVKNSDFGLKAYEFSKKDYSNIEYYEDNNRVYDTQEQGTNKVTFNDKFNIYANYIPILKKYMDDYSKYFKNYTIKVGETKSINDLISKNTSYRMFKVYSTFECNLDVCNNTTDETVISVPAESNNYVFTGLKVGSTKLIIYDELSGYLDTVTINVVDNNEYNQMHKLVLDSNYNSSINEELYIKSGETYGDLPIPERTGYTFLGWFTKRENGSKINSNTVFNSNSDVTIYAHWQAYHIVTFKNYYGDYIPEQIVIDGGNATKPTNPTRDGFALVGWSLNGVIFDFSTPIESDITLIAVWQEAHMIYFNSRGGSEVPDQAVIDGECAVKPEDPVLEGYTFKEWQLNGVTYDFNTAVTSNITLRAVWTANQYTVTFNSDGGISVASQIINYNGKATKPSNPTKTGYTFKEWQLNGVTYDFNTAITSNITLKAVWTANQYTVTFNSDGGSSVASQTINYNGKATKPTNPIKTGYTFKEWRLNGQTYDFNTEITSNITLTAVWDKNEIIDDNTLTLKNTLENNGYSVNGSLTSKFTLGDSIATIKNKLCNGVIIETDKNIIATGAVIKKGNESYTVVIKGDLTGDGKINSGDLLQMRKYLLEEVNLTSAYKQAGIIESNNGIKSLDLLRLRQYLLGEYTFK